jgi:hypothetical protein
VDGLTSLFFSEHGLLHLHIGRKKLDQLVGPTDRP